MRTGLLKEPFLLTDWSLFVVVNDNLNNKPYFEFRFLNQNIYYAIEFDSKFNKKKQWNTSKKRLDHKSEKVLC